MSDLVAVRMGGCRCPGTPHADGDFAYLKPKADPRLGFAVRAVVTQGYTEAITAQVEIGRVYLMYGIANWDRLDENGKPMPVNGSTVDSLAWEEAEAVYNKADDLYSEDIFRPLVARLPKVNGRMPASSQNGRTGDSTSPRKASSPSRRRRS